MERKYHANRIAQEEDRAVMRKCEDYVKWQRRRFEELEEQNREKDTDYALIQMSQKWGDRRY